MLAASSQQDARQQESVISAEKQELRNTFNSSSLSFLSEFEQQDIAAHECSASPHDRKAGQCTWAEQICILIDKAAKTKTLFDMRPITLLCILMKLFMMIIVTILQTSMYFKGWHQHGARKTFQCLEIVSTIRLLLEKSLEWALPIVIISLDFL